MKKQLLSFAATAGILLSTFGGSASAHENVYSVQSGDTLWKISQANKVSITDLKTWNHLTSDTLYVNQRLTLLAPHSHETGTATYTVQKGDTLYLIAIRNKLSVAQLKSLNNLTSDTIYVGQVLNVSSSGTSIPAPSPTVSKAQMVMDEAKKYIGTPYLWGGNTPAGFDCSGLTSYVFNKVGITIPRTAATQWSGLKVVTTPKPGDLVFFETYAPGPTHVGIYLGNNQFIQAGSKGVSIADMTNSYWKPRYLGARTAF
ncbi:C40 family peptidase [Bacillus sp. sid0103]|uniref:C40 family peptidase n=1 Tax=Bacillus sp. sid0103 TaxID=2856337 RepID=UPI001C4767CF|nr:C40 family peptidase [Bacillus sp. sid0103]MBV7504691.1 C40 family peptidase [Bacillus sp. sid0103]